MTGDPLFESIISVLVDIYTIISVTQNLLLIRRVLLELLALLRFI